MATEETRARVAPVEVPAMGLPPLGLAGADALAGPADHQAQRAARFDEVYTAANGEAARVPWAGCRACPLLVQWLNVEAPLLVRPGSRTAVVGCGLGDDVVELADRGYDVLGFDISATAVRWAARRHPAHAERFMVADLLSLHPRLMRRFDLVIEAYTLQSLEAALRPGAAAAVASLIAPRGVVLVLARARQRDEDGAEPEPCVAPPYSMSPDELLAALAPAGLHPIAGHGGVEEIVAAPGPEGRRLRGVFGRA